MSWQDATRKNVHVRVIKDAIEVLHKYYPERLGHCIIYPTYPIVIAMWKLIKHFFDDNAVSKLPV